MSTFEISQVTDRNLDAITSAGCGVLMLAKSDCGHCANYAAEIMEAVAAGRLPELKVGKMLLDAPGSGKFKLKNPWIAKLGTLPYTIVFSEGRVLGHFATSKASYLEEKLEQLMAVA